MISDADGGAHDHSKRTSIYVPCRRDSGKEAVDDRFEAREKLPTTAEHSCGPTGGPSAGASQREKVFQGRRVRWVLPHPFWTLRQPATRILPGIARICLAHIGLRPVCCSVVLHKSHGARGGITTEDRTQSLWQPGRFFRRSGATPPGTSNWKGGDAGYGTYLGQPAYRAHNLGVSRRLRLNRPQKIWLGRCVAGFCDSLRKFH